MRVDKFLSITGMASRSEASKAARAGNILIDGIAVRDVSVHIDPQKNEVKYCGAIVAYREHTYIMLNKPEGYISATDDPRAKEKTVLDLLDERFRKIGMFPCGRLDKDTVGLLILTDNGALAHQLLSPKHHAEKVYFFRCIRPVSEQDALLLERGIVLDDGYKTLPCRVKIDENSRCEGQIILTEGKFHQIKRMLEAVENKIIFLERIEFGGIPLDRALERGKWRFLAEDEIKLLENHGVK